jgi:mycofactocin system glycosyltransferase
MGYRLAEGVERVEARGGPALLGQTPLRLVRLNAALAELIARPGELVARSPGEARALEALFRKGLLVRESGTELPAQPLPSISVVIPVKDRADELRRCLESLARIRYAREQLEIVVVDDGSRDTTPEVARSLGAVVVPSGGEGRGPAAARNRGAAVARGDILAFIDSDCTASEEWLSQLCVAFEDPEVVAVGGRVDGMHAASALDRYEAEMSSLSLGPRGRSGQAGNDTFYLPSCNLLVRRKEFAACGGFREELHVGEDVDLTWRLRDRGGKIVYMPRGEICHEHRNRLRAFLRRRFQYGTSEGLLHTLHPARRKKMLMPAALALGVLLGFASILSGRWWLAAAGCTLVALDSARLWLKLRRQQVVIAPVRVLLARSRALGSLAYYLSFHLVRYYAPVLIVLGVVWPRAGLLFAAMALGAGLVDFFVRRPALLFPTFFAFYLAEHLAYGAGVFCGCVRQGSFGSYRPLFSAKD